MIYDFYNISTEGVGVNYGDLDVIEIESLFSDLIHAIKSGRMKSSLDLKKTKITKKILESIDKIIEKRFGFKSTHLGTEHTIYATVLASPRFSTSLDENNEQTLEDIERMVGRDIRNRGQTDLELATSLEEDYIPILKNKVANSYRLQEALFGKGITIDFDKGRISGGGEELNIVFAADFVSLVNVHGATSKEITAILLHEIGHAFTHISYMYRKFKNATVVMESFLESLGKSKKKTDVVKIMGKELYNMKQTKTSTEMGVKVAEHSVEYIYSKDTQSYKDSEQLADQFAARFGYGVEISSVLARLTLSSKSMESVFLDMFLASAVQMVIFFLITGGIFTNIMGVALMVGGLAIAFLSMYVIVKIYGYMVNLTVGDGDSNKVTYDVMFDRVNKVRLDIIRQLRLGLLSKDHYAQAINNIDTLVRVMRKFKDNKQLTASIGSNSIFVKDSYTYTRALKVIEELSENSLHVSANRLKTLTTRT